MNTSKRIHLLFISVFIFSIGCQSPPKTDPKIEAYLRAAMDTIQKNALNTTQVNWDKLRQEVIEKAQGAKSTPEVYHLLRYVLKSLNDNHSFIQLSDSLAALEKKAQKPENQTKKKQQAKKQPSPYEPRMKIEYGIHTVDNIKVARIFVPKGSRGNKFAQRLHDRIIEMNAQKPCGWIIDLRGNLGGNMWPMLAGIGHLVGENPLGGSVDAQGNRDFYLYKSGKAIYVDKSGKENVYAQVKESPFTAASDIPIAFLIDRSTASSGEALAVILKGRKNTRSFGEVSYGASTSTRGFKLSDGANLVLAVSTFEDKNKNKYPNGIKPNETIPVGQQKMAPEEDPIIKTALHWLKQQTSCTK